MDLNHMRTMYEVGRLSDATIVDDPKDHSCTVECHDLWGHTLPLTAEDGKPCHYPNHDQAEEAAHDIGFQQKHEIHH